MSRVKIISLGFAVPKYSYSQAEIFEALGYPRPFWRIFRDSEIDTRHFCAPIEELKGLSFQEQQDKYLIEAEVLALHAIEDCLEGRGVQDIRCITYSTCFPKGNKVITEDGLKDISDTKVGDVVFTHGKRWQKVEKALTREYSGTLIKVHRNTEPMIEATPEHPFLVYRNPWKSERTFRKYMRTDKLPEPEWIQARELKRGDYLVCPKPAFSVSESTKKDMVTSFRQATGVLKGPGLLQNIQDAIGKDFLWLCGMYVAEGSTWGGKKSGHAQTCFSLGWHEKNKADRLQSIAEKMGYKASIYNNTKHSITILIPSSNLTKFLTAWFGKGALHKRIASWIYKLGDEDKKFFIDGMWEGDGCIAEKGKMIYSTVSQELAEGLLLLLFSLGKRASLHKNNNRKDAYGKNPIFNVRTRKTEGEYQQHVYLLRDKFVFPITGIDQREAKCELVYNLEVQGDNSYICGMASVHNCTGFPPGPTIGDYLAADLHLPHDIQINNLSSHGCEGAFPGLRRCHDFTVVNSVPSLAIACELTSLTYYPEDGAHPDPENDYELARSWAIFADGCSCALLGYDDDPKHPEIIDFTSCIDTDHMGELGYVWRNGRLRVRLSRQVPVLAAALFEKTIRELLKRNNLNTGDVAYWVLHPPGAAVLNMVRDKLAIDEEKLKYSRKALRLFGNTSSSSVGIVGKLLIGEEKEPKGYLVMANVGPGMASNACLLQFGV